MSTAFEWRDLDLLQRRDVATEEPREWSDAAAMLRPVASERRVQAPSRAVTVRLRQQLNRARVVAAIIVALSILGLAYLTQISHVARFGYLLSALQRQQVRCAFLHREVIERRLANLQIGSLRKAGPKRVRTPVFHGAWKQ